MLPIMREQAGLGLGAGGWLATANYAGYFTGVFLCGRISDLNLKDRLYRWGLILAVISTAMMGMVSSEVGWAISRFLAGLSTAVGMMLGGALVMNWLMRNGHRAELGVHFSGVGLSVVMSSFAVLMLSEHVLWWENWLFLSLLGLVFGAACIGLAATTDARPGSGARIKNAGPTTNSRGAKAAAGVLFLRRCWICGDLDIYCRNR